MGLNFNHCDARWSYIGFHRFRQRLATQININLDDMWGFGGLCLSWDYVADPIKFLLNHSDCDGILLPEVCGIVAPRLREMIEHWDEDRDKEQALMLAEGMEYCAANREILIFC